MRKAVVVDDDPIIRLDLADILSRENFEIVGEGCDGFDAVELCERHRPDLVLMDIKMPTFDGLDAARNIIDQNFATCVIVVSAFNNEDFVAKAKEYGVSAYLVKPVDQRTLLPAIEVALAQSERIQKIQGENENIRKKLSQRTLVDKAKTLLAKKEGISESEAYAQIQKLSMDKSTGMAEVAKRIVDADNSRATLDKAKSLLMDKYRLGEKAAYRRIQTYAEERGLDVAAAAAIVRDHDK